MREAPQPRACSPLELLECLAAGTPVVATGGPALDGFRDVLAAVSGADWFIRALPVTGEARSDPDRARLQRRSIDGRSWDKAARQVADLMDRL